MVYPARTCDGTIALSKTTCQWILNGLCRTYHFGIDFEVINLSEKPVLYIHDILWVERAGTDELEFLGCPFSWTVHYSSFGSESTFRNMFYFTILRCADGVFREHNAFGHLIVKDKDTHNDPSTCNEVEYLPYRKHELPPQPSPLDYILFFPKSIQMFFLRLSARFGWRWVRSSIRVRFVIREYMYSFTVLMHGDDLLVVAFL